MNTLSIRSDIPSAAGREHPAYVTMMPSRPVTVGERRARVLYVDDERDLLRLGALVLSRAGYEVDTAADGVAAWSALRERNYQLLITDNQMPGMTGVDLIRNLRLEGLTLPTILASGTLGTLPLEELPWLDRTALLAKPFSTAELLGTVHKLLPAAPAERSPAHSRSPLPNAVASRLQSHHSWGLNE